LYTTMFLRNDLHCVGWGVKLYSTNRHWLLKNVSTYAWTYY